MSRLEKTFMRDAIRHWMRTMDWPYMHAARWVIRRQRRGLVG